MASMNYEFGEDKRPARLMPAGQTLPQTRDPYGSMAYGAPPPEAEGSIAQDLLEYWRIICKRRWLILGIVIAFVSITGIRTLMMTPLYTASVRMQIDRQALKVIQAGEVETNDPGAYDFLKTEYELLRSRSIAERVASALKLGEDQDFFKQQSGSILSAIRNAFQSASPDELVDSAALERWAADILLSNSGVRPVPGSRLVDLTYTDPDPRRAQRIANAYAEAYIASNLDKRFQANAYAKTFLEDQIQQMKLRLEESEKTLLDFAEREQIVLVTEKASIAESNLAAANAALGEIISERIRNEQLWKQVAEASAINVPQLLSNSVIEGLRAQRNTLTAEYQEKLEVFKPTFPAMLEITSKIKEIDRQLASEVKTIKSSLKAAYDTSVSQEKAMQEHVEKLRKEVLDLQKRSIQYNLLKREVDTTRSLYNELLQRYKEVDVASGVGTNNVFIVDRAEVPGAPSSPKIMRALVLAFGLGLGVGLASAYLLERLDDTIRAPEEIERLSGLATLGVIPKIEGGKTVEAEFADPRSALSEAYRSLCTALQFSTDEGLPKTLLISSSSPSEGKSITSLAIARHFAAMGQKVLLVDADLRNPSLHIKLGLDAHIGLTSYLTGVCNPPEAFQRTPYPNLFFMASGPLPPNAADLLASARVHSLLAIGHEVFDLIILDGPPVMGLADAPILSSAVAGTVFVIGAGQTRTGVIRTALKRLQLSRGSLIGAVLTKFDAKAASYGYGYDYGYGYGSSYGSASEDSGQDDHLVESGRPQLAKGNG